jgi:hypothetical protein
LPLRGNADTQAVYAPFKVQYPNLNQGRPVDTLTEQALLITHVWHSPDAEARLADLRLCITANTDKLKDESQTPTWQDITAGDQGPDPKMWYALTVQMSATPVNHAAAKAPKK